MVRKKLYEKFKELLEGGKFEQAFWLSTGDWFQELKLLTKAGTDYSIKNYRDVMLRLLNRIDERNHFFQFFYLRIDKDKLREAEAHILEAIRLNPDYYHYRMHYADLLERMGRIEEAEKEYLIASGLEPVVYEDFITHVFNPHQRLYELYTSMGRHEEAAAQKSRISEWEEKAKNTRRSDFDKNSL